MWSILICICEGDKLVWKMWSAENDYIEAQKVADKVQGIVVPWREKKKYLEGKTIESSLFSKPTA